MSGNTSSSIYNVLEARGVSRRSFMKLCGSIAVAAGLSAAAAPRVALALETNLEGAKDGLFPVLWIAGASRTGGT